MTDAFSNLLSLLDIASGEQKDLFIGKCPGGTRRRLFGGHVAAQALMAMGRTVPGIPAHSLHAYFLRPGDPHNDIEYRVTRLRDGRSFCTRSVVAVQAQHVIFQASASFVITEQGFEHQRSAPNVPPPAACLDWDQWVGPRLAQMSEEQRRQFTRERPIELRPADPVDAVDPRPAGTTQNFWCRPLGTLPDADPLLHQCVATFTSDHTLLSAVLRPHGRTFMSRGVMAASLDHTIWFHRPFRADQWLLYAQETPLAFGARGLSFGHFFDEQGTLLVSMAQEGLVRQR